MSPVKVKRSDSVAKSNPPLEVVAVSQVSPFGRTPGALVYCGNTPFKIIVD
jgi:hypothetical protein